MFGHFTTLCMKGLKCSLFSKFGWNEVLTCFICSFNFKTNIPPCTRELLNFQKFLPRDISAGLLYETKIGEWSLQKDGNMQVHWNDSCCVLETNI